MGINRQIDHLHAILLKNRGMDFFTVTNFQKLHDLLQVKDIPQHKHVQVDHCQVQNASRAS